MGSYESAFGIWMSFSWLSHIFEVIVFWFGGAEGSVKDPIAFKEAGWCPKEVIREIGSAVLSEVSIAEVEVDHTDCALRSHTILVIEVRYYLIWC
jgi:hypothetical protein